MTLAIASLAVSVLAMVVSLHSAVYAGVASFYRRRIQTRIFDNPEPWYVRYANWLERRLVKVRSRFVQQTASSVNRPRDRG